eukprot:3015006-Rhodomonas_salina.1
MSFMIWFTSCAQGSASQNEGAQKHAMRARTHAVSDLDLHVAGDLSDPRHHQAERLLARKVAEESVRREEADLAGGRLG